MVTKTDRNSVSGVNIKEQKQTDQMKMKGVKATDIKAHRRMLRLRLRARLRRLRLRKRDDAARGEDCESDAGDLGEGGKRSICKSPMATAP